MAIIAFLKALGKRWWALMSCAVFTVLGVFVAITNKSNSWIFWASCIAAILLFLVAAFGAWNDEHEAKVRAEKLLKDEEPKIMFGLLSSIDWATLDSFGEFVFTLTNYGKRPATYVRLESIRSVAGVFTIYFQEIDILRADGHYRPILHEIDDGQIRKPLDKRKLWEFLHNCSAEQTTEIFDVLIRFRDLEKERQTISKLQFDLNTKKLTILRN